MSGPIPEEEQQGTGDLVLLGKIGAPYGVRGWVTVVSYTDPRENILSYGEWQLRHRQELRSWRVTEGGRQGKRLIASLAGCEDRDLAAGLSGAEILVRADELPALEDGEYYWHDLEGLQVVNAEEQILGSVSHLLETGANDVLVVRPAEQSIDQRERLIPLIWDSVVLAVDTGAGMIRVDWSAEY